MKARILAILGALTLAIGLGVGSGGTARAAGYGDQFCTNGFCLNAWSGGPYVNEYQYEQNGVANSEFTIVQHGNGTVGIQFTGDTYPYENDCISDYGNNQFDARAGLNGNCANGQIAWGANFYLQSCPGGLQFENVHWKNGYLSPSDRGNGTPFYLNSPTPACFIDYPFG
jgi:hypothetical protein